MQSHRDQPGPPTPTKRAAHSAPLAVANVAAVATLAVVNVAPVAAVALVPLAAAAVKPVLQRNVHPSSGNSRLHLQVNHACPHHTSCVQGKCISCMCAACVSNQVVPGSKRAAKCTLHFDQMHPVATLDTAAKAAPPPPLAVANVAPPNKAAAPMPPAAATAKPSAKRALNLVPHLCPHHTSCVQGKCVSCMCAACVSNQVVPGTKRAAKGNMPLSAVARQQPSACLDALPHLSGRTTIRCFDCAGSAQQCPSCRQQQQ